MVFRASVILKQLFPLALFVTSFFFRKGEIETIGRLIKAGKASLTKPSSFHFIGGNAREERPVTRMKRERKLAQ